MNAQYPELEEKPAAREGTAAHFVFGELFFNRVVAEGQIAPNGVVITEEMLEGAELYVDTIDARLAAVGMDRSALMVERRVEIPRVHPQNWGTPDTWFYDRERGSIPIFDFKFGHDFVDAFENWQLINYAAGIMDALKIDGLSDQHTRIEMTVVQPRNYSARGSVRTWSVMAWELRGYVNRLRNAAEAAHSPNRVATPNDACEHCPGRHACQALEQSAYLAAEKAGDSTPLELKPAAAALELRYLQRAQKRLDARVSGLVETLTSQIKRGVPVPGFMLEATAGRETWNKPAPEVLALGQVLGVNVAKPGLLTPKQAIKAGMPEAVVAAYVERPTGGTKLVPVDGSDAARVFR